MLYTQTVEATTLDLIKTLMNDIELSVFNLVGGTALSLMMGHRKSIDIDLFIDRDFNVQHLASHLSKTYHAEGMKTLKNGIFCYINDVKIDLIAHQYPILNPLKIEDGIRMLSLEDISAMKLSAILNSGRRLKDFVDMHFLLEKLPIEKRAQIIRMLIKGNSLRLTSRMADVSINTVNKLLIDTGKACQQFHNDTVVKVKSKRVHADEIWSFVDSKEKNTSAEMKEQGKGDAWTWVGIDADSKLVISWQVDDKNADAACAFMYDIADRLANRVQLTTDGHMAYLDAVERAFDNDIDYAQLVKIYGGSEKGNENERKYSPAVCTGSKKTTVTGEPTLNL